MKNKIILNIGAWLLFSLGILADKLWGIEYAKFLPGVLLLYYLPGNNLNDLLFHKVSSKISWYIKLSLDIASSIAVIYLSYNLFKVALNYYEPKIYVFILALNILLFAVNLLVHWRLKLSFPFKKLSFKEDKWLIVIATVPVLLFVVRLIFNPYIYELDSSQYFHIFNSILSRGYDISWLTGQRNGFAIYMIFSKYVCGISFIGFTKFFIPLLFFITSTVLFDFVRKIKSRPLAILSYLLVMASPFLSIGNEGVRPETFVFVLTYPVLYLIYKSIEEDSIGYSMFALLLSYVAFRFHEFGFFMMLSSAVALVMVLYRTRHQIAKTVRTYPVYSAVLVLSYLLLVAQNFTSLKSIFSAQIFSAAGFQIGEYLKNPHWNWWFLNNFTSIDGGNVQWPGYSFVLYYLYDGIFALLLLIAVVAVYLRVKKKRGVLKSGSFLLPSLPVIIFLLAYLTIAEIFPRLSLALLPNRAWPHIILSSVFLIIIVFLAIERKKGAPLQSKTVLLAVLFTVIMGVGGTMVGSVFMGGQVLPAERGAIKALKDLPKDSVIVTTQVNENLIEMYGQKIYIPFDKVSFNDQPKFRQAMFSAVDDYQLSREAIALSGYAISQADLVTISRANKSHNYLLKGTVLTDVQAKMDALKKYDLEEYNDMVSEMNQYNSLRNRPIYYLYSFAKFDGVLARRQWWVEDNDPQNKLILQEYKGSDVVYRDADSILIKIQ